MKSLEKIVEEQIQKWQIGRREEKKAEAVVSVITLSREPGSGGRLVAKGLAFVMGYDLFHQEVINGMAESADMSRAILETLDEKGVSLVEDWVSSMMHARHLWPDRYLRHLMKVIGAIGRHGNAVIVGRGANFILPPERIFRVRVVEPQSKRVNNVARDFKVSKEEALVRVMRTESDRRAFVRKYFNADITDPVHYDLMINTEKMSIDRAVRVIQAALAVT